MAASFCFQLVRMFWSWSLDYHGQRIFNLDFFCWIRDFQFKFAFVDFHTGLSFEFNCVYFQESINCFKEDCCSSLRLWTWSIITFCQLHNWPHQYSRWVCSFLSPCAFQLQHVRIFTTTCNMLSHFDENLIVSTSYISSKFCVLFLWVVTGYLYSIYQLVVIMFHYGFMNTRKA